jgi:hypothetical protein
MRVEVNILGQVDIECLVKGILRCAEEEVCRQELDQHGLPFDEAGIIGLCLRLGPYNMIDNILEKKSQITQLCEYLNIQIQPKDKRSDWINRVCAKITNAEYPFRVQGDGFFVLRKYIRQKDGMDVKKEDALDLVTRIEKQVRELYFLFLGRVCYNSLDKKWQETYIKTFDSKININHCIDHLQKLESVIQNKPDYQESIMEVTGRTSIFGDAELSRLKDIFSIRNTLIAHLGPGSKDKNLVSQKCKKLFVIARDFVEKCCEVMDPVIFPVHFGVNEWGFRYIAYVDENDLDTKGNLSSDCIKIVDDELRPELCNRFYLFKKPAEFYQYQKAYCFSPLSRDYMFDPSIYYASHLYVFEENLKELM